jgi:hypothetical protein
MTEPRFTQEERAEIFRSFLDVDPKRLLQAQTVAALVSEDESDPEEAALAITYFYSQKENEKLLDEMLKRLSISDI